MEKISKRDLEKDRSSSIEELQIIDTIAEDSFDNITETAAYVCDCPISLVTILYEDRQWFKSKKGLYVDETKREVAFCEHAIHQEPLIYKVPAASKSALFKDNPLVTGKPNIEFYCGAKIFHPNGIAIGTLCVIDRKARELSVFQENTLLMLAQQVTNLIAKRLEKKKAEENKVQLSKILENTDDLIYELDEEGNVTYANATALKTFNITTADLPNFNLLSLIPPEHSFDVSVSLSELISAKVQNAKNEFILKINNEEEIWLSQTLKRRKDKKKLKIVAVSREITDEKENADRLKRLSLVAENTTNVVILMNKNFEIEWVNNSFVRVFGYRLREVEGLIPGDFLNGKNTDMNQVEEETQKLKNGEPILMEIINYDKQGNEKWIEMSINPVFSESGFLINYVAVEHDITTRKKQQDLIARQNKEIIDSMEYATRIQQATLPSDHWRRELKTENAILYQPKEIVSGDFYLAERIWINEGDYIEIFVVADCTGHGVPGAMLSVLCSNLLVEAINEFRVQSPGAALDYAKRRLRDFLQIEGEKKVYDGMDIAFLAIDHKKKEVSFSGANRPLYYIMNGELKTIKGDKQSIGYSKKPFKFTTHEINYKTGTYFYLFSDGIVDQFGGERNRKFMSKRLKSILVENHSMDLDSQRNELQSKLSEWKGDQEQTDDMCFMALKI